MAIMFSRDTLANTLVNISETQNYWGYIYTIDMISLALVFHGIFMNHILVDLITETFAWFCWQDVAERLFFHNTSFTKEDLLFIFIAIVTILYKVNKWIKK